MSRSLWLLALSSCVVLLFRLLSPDDAPQPLPPGDYRIVLSGELDVAFRVDDEGAAAVGLVTPPADVDFMEEEGRVLDRLRIRTPTAAYDVEIILSDRGTYNVVAVREELD